MDRDFYQGQVSTHHPHIEDTIIDLTLNTRGHLTIIIAQEGIHPVQHRNNKKSNQICEHELV